MVADAASLAVIEVNVSGTAHPVADDGKVWTEGITIIALITYSAVETSLSLLHREILRNRQLDFTKIPDPFFERKLRLCQPGAVLKIIRIDLFIPDYVSAVSTTRSPGQPPTLQASSFGPTASAPSRNNVSSAKAACFPEATAWTMLLTSLYTSPP